MRWVYLNWNSEFITDPDDEYHGDSLQVCKCGYWGIHDKYDGQSIMRCPNCKRSTRPHDFYVDAVKDWNSKITPFIAVVIEHD